MKIFTLACMLAISATATISQAEPDSATQKSEIEIPAAPTAPSERKFFGSIALYPQTEYGKTDSLMIWTTPGLSYAYDSNLTFTLKQTFETLTGYSNEDITRNKMGENNFRAAFTDIIVSSSLPGFLGITSIPVSLDYRNMNHDGIKVSGWNVAHALIEGNLSLPYAITSHVDVALDTQIRHYVMKSGPNADRFLAVPTLGYAFNDVVRVYQSAGYVVSTKDDTDFRRNYERMYLETGIVVNPIKNLTLKFDAYQDKAISASPSSGVDVSDFNLYTPTVAKSGPGATLDVMAYEAVITYKF